MQRAARWVSEQSSVLGRGELGSKGQGVGAHVCGWSTEKGEGVGREFTCCPQSR